MCGQGVIRSTATTGFETAESKSVASVRVDKGELSCPTTPPGDLAPGNSSFNSGSCKVQITTGQETFFINLHIFIKQKKEIN